MCSNPLCGSAHLLKVEDPRGQVFKQNNLQIQIVVPFKRKGKF